jgi:hypothetical protein
MTVQSWAVARNSVKVGQHPHSELILVIVCTFLNFRNSAIASYLFHYQKNKQN